MLLLGVDVEYRTPARRTNAIDAARRVAAISSD